MENMTNLKELKQYNFDFELFIISDNFTIYKTKFQSNFPKEDFIKRIQQNKSLYYNNNIRNNHSLEFNIECIEFNSIDSFFIKCLEKIKNTKINKIAKYSWTYTQTKEFSVEWMDDHKELHRFDKSHINTNLVCVHYIAVPFGMKKGEGDLIFKNENNELFYFTPEENDVLIFSGILPHMTTPNKSSNTDRISYVSNFNFELFNNFS
jgi:hypothetical protein